ncbi:hypothetical protein [Parabacteroides sp.]
MNNYNNIIIYPFLSSSSRENRHLLSFQGQYFEATTPIVELVKELQHYPTEAMAIEAYCQKKAGKYTPEQVRQIINKFIMPLFIPKVKQRTFLYEKELFGVKAINRFSDTFRFLFNRTYMVIVLVIMLVLNIYFFRQTQDLLVFNDKIDIYLVIGLFLFMLVSSFFHELGHASACKYYGIQHGAIGFGLYLTFPVLYTDVTEVWKLNRIQRCVVNIAGVYFQSYCLIGLLIGFFLTGNNILRYLILIMNFGFLMTLNPFFKFDGYWIASDLLGVPNLRARSKELLGYWYRRMRKLPVKTEPYLLQIRPAAKYGLLIYSIVVNLFMGFYFFYIIPSFLYRFVCTFPDAVNELILYLSNGMTPPFALLRNIGSQLLFLALIGYLFWKLIQPFVKRYVKQ